MKITEGAIFIIVIFIGIAFVPASCMSDNATIDEWMQDHTVEVNATTTCKYEQGYLLINETYTGEELKARFGVEFFTKELKMPVEDNVLVEGRVLGMREGEERILVTEKETVLTTGDDPSQWWDEYKYPQWVWFKSGDIYEKGLPISLAWKNTTKDTAKSEILEEGWVDNPIQWTEYVYDSINGWIIGDGVATSTFGIFGRYHANLWQMSDGNAVANTHHDTPVPHEADELEEAEELVAGFFNEYDDTEWNVYEDSYNLDNNVTSPYSDGWCTQIYFGSDATPPVVTITSPKNGSIVSTPNVTLTGYATDDVGIVSVCYAQCYEKICGGSCDYPSNASTNVSFNWTVGLQEGENIITVTAYDAANNSGNASVVVTCNYSEEVKANLSIDYKKREITIKGKSADSDKIDIAIIGPEGFTEVPLCFENGFAFYNSSVDTNNSWEIVIQFPEGVKEGSYIAAIYFPGKDNSYGASGYGGGALKDYLLSEYDIESLVGSTQEALLDILNELTAGAAGSDDLVDELLFNLEIGVPFDTGGPTNPYPSISGNHTGTITLTQTLRISKLYTYPCPGTGGHTEYAAISYSNGTEIAEAHWNGYIGDWHNISFNETFTLIANETYNYIIRTGSYPQIHHTDELEVASGTITCEEFVDTNGKRYDNWIPATKLFL
ncbi:MAG: Ig-like domain-containing protein [Euryarchaeota archaeon]|nr:Ig-like domain-containing protein [Euryarchaeota archaeon]